MDNLKSEMKKKKVTQKQLANLLGVHRMTIGNKLEGETDFTFGEAMKIREAYFREFDATYLFSKEEE